MDLSQSIISHRDSQILKGILILLIVLGHNGILMGKAPGLEVNTVNRYLYHFHVYLFLILPFLYNAGTLTWSNVKKHFIRLYKPYTVLFLLLIAANFVLYRAVPDPRNLVCAYVTGNEPLIKDAIGASFPWFLPTMFSILLMRDWSNGRNMLPVLLVSIIIFVLARVFDLFTLYEINWFAGAGIAIAYYSVAIIARVICNRLNVEIKYGKLVTAIAIISSILFFVFSDSFSASLLFKLNAWLIMPLSIFASLYFGVRFMKDTKMTKGIVYLGKHSLAIYMLHMFIYNVFELIIYKYDFPLNFIVGLISYLATIMFTLMLIWLLEKARLDKILF